MSCEVRFQLVRWLGNVQLAKDVKIGSRVRRARGSVMMMYELHTH